MSADSKTEHKTHQDQIPESVASKITQSKYPPRSHRRVRHAVSLGLDTNKPPGVRQPIATRCQHSRPYTTAEQKNENKNISDGNNRKDTANKIGRIGIIKKSPSMYDKRERTLSIKKGFSLPFKMLFG